MHPPPRYECWIVCGSRELADGAWVTVRLDQLAKRHGYPRVAVGNARAAHRHGDEDRAALCWALALTHLLGWARG